MTQHQYYFANIIIGIVSIAIGILNAILTHWRPSRDTSSFHTAMSKRCRALGNDLPRGLTALMVEHGSNVMSLQIVSEDEGRERLTCLFEKPELAPAIKKLYFRVFECHALYSTLQRLRYIKALSATVVLLAIGGVALHWSRSAAAHFASFDTATGVMLTLVCQSLLIFTVVAVRNQKLRKRLSTLVETDSEAE